MGPLLTFMGLHVHGVLLEALHLANECHWLSYEVVELIDSNEGMGLSVDCFHFL
jgi:sirohydrochlorin ferrochelatase